MLVAVCLMIAGFFLLYSRLDSIAKSAIESVGSSLTGTPVRVEAVKISPREGTGELQGFSVGNPAGFKSPTAIKAGSVALSINIKSLRQDKLVVPSIKMSAPEITFEGGLKGNNLSALLEQVQKGSDPAQKPVEKKESNTQKKLQVDEILITGAKVNVGATILGGTAVSLVLPDIQITKLGQGPEGITAGEISEKILRILLEKTLEATAKNLQAVGKQLKDGVSVIPGAGTNAVEAVGKGLKNIFK